MAKRFSELRAKMPPAAQARAHAKAEAMLAEMPLDELRQARGVQQPSIAKLEKRTDMYLSTLRAHIEAMGGDLVVLARFPEGAVRIKNFGELDEPIEQRRKSTK
jgi:hypothetical protein